MQVVSDVGRGGRSRVGPKLSDGTSRLRERQKGSSVRDAETGTCKAERRYWVDQESE